MGTFIQEFAEGSITKNLNGSYSYEVNGRVVGTFGTVKELVDSLKTKPPTKKPATKKANK